MPCLTHLRITLDDRANDDNDDTYGPMSVDMLRNIGQHLQFLSHLCPSMDLVELFQFLPGVCPNLNHLLVPAGYARKPAMLELRHPELEHIRFPATMADAEHTSQILAALRLRNRLPKLGRVSLFTYHAQDWKRSRNKRGLGF